MPYTFQLIHESGHVVDTAADGSIVLGRNTAGINMSKRTSREQIKAETDQGGSPTAMTKNQGIQMAEGDVFWLLENENKFTIKVSFDGDDDNDGAEDMAEVEEEEERKPAADEESDVEDDARPVCQYGAKCYRKNPQHFKEFAHPWMKKTAPATAPRKTAGTTSKPLDSAKGSPAKGSVAKSPSAGHSSFKMKSDMMDVDDPTEDFPPLSAKALSSAAEILARKKRVREVVAVALDDGSSREKKLKKPSYLAADQWYKKITEATNYAARTKLRQDAIDHENYNRKLYAKFRDDPEIQDPYCSLVKVHGAASGGVWRALPILKEEAAIPVVMPVPEKKRIAVGEPCIVDRDEFLVNWRIFTENMLQDMDWSNVFAAGGSVTGCLAPVPADKKGTLFERREYLRETFPGSDIDLQVFYIYDLSMPC
ncbi:hypothetical protein HK101_011769 [Irineochytrium annulatum]|nr:hypothetical protein HK101_011769 [Irineochytrium annulatum]